MTHEEALQRLDQRRRWLTARIAAKQSIQWDVEYDTAERDALQRILDYLHDEHANGRRKGTWVTGI